MKFLKQGLSLALLGAGLTAVPGLQAAASGQSPAAAADSLVQQIRNEARGDVAVSAERATGMVGFVRAGLDGDLLPAVSAGSSDAAAAAKATTYLTRFAPAFGATAAQLERTGVRSNGHGWTVSYLQRYRGVPVFGSEIRAHIDEDGDLTAVNGYAAPDLDLSTDPRISEDAAAERAIAAVRANPPGDDARTDTRGIGAASTDLVVYRLGAIKGEVGEAVLAYSVEVTNARNVRDMVVVDAATSKVINRYSMISNALERELYEAVIDDNGTPDDETDDFIRFDLVWEEGDPLPGRLNRDQTSMVRSTGDSYWFFRNAFGRDSYDAEGATMRVVNNDPRISCPNANWNGETTNYCDGVSSDDIVAHEWGHAYTQFTSDLIYQWQPGAMNEAYSDIWGETIDLINGRLDADEGDLTRKRRVGACSTHSPPLPLLTINSPEAIAGPCLTGGTLGTLDQPITDDVVGPSDPAEPGEGPDPGGTTTDGCSPYDDPAAARGQIVLVDRGYCTFVQKAQVAKAAGARALIIGNNDEGPIGFSDPDTTLPPTVSIGLSDREDIRSALAVGENVNVTIEEVGGQRQNNYRWLMGEDSEAFGGAIRDMWTPTCYGDPGKVSDAEYKCSTDDSGGVHSNSGVVNHAYSLLVDGGTYNDVTVRRLGMHKAAAIFWRAQSEYLTPTSDFVDLAGSLVASCEELVGADIKKLSTRANANPGNAAPITAGNCRQVMAASNAVELRREPTQCNFRPMLKKGAPPVCGEGTKSKVLFRDGFGKGLSKWRKSSEVVFEGGRGFPWRATTDVPGRHRGKAAFAPDPADAGNCSGAEGDVSSRNSITSPRVTMVGGKSGRLSFRHYMATEPGYDGGNVKMKVNGGRFQVIPASAYVFNAPQSTILTEAEGNTNPLAGEQGFTGTDGGQVTGSWGKSIINLKKAGVSRGDTVRIRFDFGRDGCGGNDGWYVDNVRMVVCKVIRNAARQ